MATIEHKVGLFFGSFNPIHVGHLIIANFMATQTDLDEVWFVVSPHNPLKNKNTLAPDYDRLHLVQRAIGDNPRLRASNVEFSLPRPSYTVDTLAYLREKFPEKEFALIMGSDNLASLHKWKNYEVLLKYYPIYVYRRPGHDPADLMEHPAVQTFDAPLMHISSSYIRRCIQNDFSVQYLVPDPVYQELLASRLYQK
jgi:nicotinate-nucleotide adenylyltransferase